MKGVEIYSYLSEMTQKGASDLYLTVNAPPTLRIGDVMQPLSNIIVQEEDMRAIMAEILSAQQMNEFNSTMELNFAMDIGKGDRFRINVLRQRQRTAMVIRRIISKIPSFEELGLPPIMKKLATEKRGLVFICGITSSGKSTTMASMVDFRNSTVGGHIITIEDPIEFYHEHKKGIITQREIGIDTDTHHTAMKNILRQKPDVIMVGEVRDAGVMEITIAAAETGHLCYATLHTKNAPQAIERIINLFREAQRQQMRMALALNLRAIIVQRLVKAVRGGLVLVSEVMLNEAFIRELILSGETNKMRDIMAANNATGMITFDQALFNHYVNGVISAETALLECDLPADMKIRIRQYGLTEKGRGNTPDIDTSDLSL